MMLFSTWLKLASCTLLVSLLTHLLTSTPLSPTHTDICYTYSTKLIITSCFLKTPNLLILMNKMRIIILKYMLVFFLVYISLCAIFLLYFSRGIICIRGEQNFYIKKIKRRDLCVRLWHSKSNLGSPWQNSGSERQALEWKHSLENILAHIHIRSQFWKS